MVCCCSVSQSCLTLCNPMDCSMPGLSVPHHFPKFAQVHVHCIGDAIHPSHPMIPSSPLPSIFPSIRDFSSESPVCIRWPKSWSFNFSISSSEILYYFFIWNTFICCFILSFCIFIFTYMVGWLIFLILEKQLHMEDALSGPVEHSPLVTRAICSRYSLYIGCELIFCGELVNVGTLVSVAGPQSGWLPGLA